MVVTVTAKFIAAGNHHDPNAFHVFLPSRVRISSSTREGFSTSACLRCRWNSECEQAKPPDERIWVHGEAP